MHAFSHAWPEAAPIKSAGRESAGLLALSVRDSVGLPTLSIVEYVGLPPDSLPALFIGAASADGRTQRWCTFIYMI